jgi:hypothetical protein
VEHVGVPAARLASALGRAFDAAQLTQLSAFLEALAERIGPDPRGDRWKAEVVTVIKERWVQQGVIDSMDDDLKYEKLLSGNPWARSFEGFCEHYKKGIDDRLKRGGGSLSREEAQLLKVFSGYGHTSRARNSYRPHFPRIHVTYHPPRLRSLALAVIHHIPSGRPGGCSCWRGCRRRRRRWATRRSTSCGGRAARSRCWSGRCRA